MSSERKIFIGGNWKCNGTKASIAALVDGLNKAQFPDVDVVVAPTALHVPFVLDKVQNRIKVAAQNSSATGNGAYTGELSPEMIKDFGLEWVIIGHSERRAYYGDSDETVGIKVKNALASGLNVIACIGETLEERKADRTLDVVFRQTKAIAANVDDWSKVVIAYEPVWAIGTGVTASPAQAQSVHDSLRTWLSKEVSPAVGASTRIIYGGAYSRLACLQVCFLGFESFLSWFSIFYVMYVL